MIRKYLLPILAFLGVLVAIYTVREGARATPAAKPVVQPSRSPYEFRVAGAGIIETTTENISIGVPVGQVVTDVMVHVDDDVHPGQQLMQLSDRTPKKELIFRQASLQAAHARLQEAEANFADLENQYAMYKKASARWAR